MDQHTSKQSMPKKRINAKHKAVDFIGGSRAFPKEVDSLFAVSLRFNTSESKSIWPALFKKPPFLIFVS